MRQTVRDAFVPFSSKLEGVVPFMYLDVRGLVTTAIGNLVDPLPLALKCPFMRGERAATRDEIAIEWRLVKDHPTAARYGHRVLEPVTRLRLTPDGITHVVGEKLEVIEYLVAARFHRFDEWPADAQLATLSLAWACGPAFHFPRLERALKAEDFLLAAEECHIRERDNPGVAPRNVANRALYRNAALVLSADLHPETLFYPELLTR